MDHGAYILPHSPVQLQSIRQPVQIDRPAPRREIGSRQEVIKY